MTQESSKKAYNSLVEKVEREIFAGQLRPGDRLETERVLAAELGISRNSVREGLRVLENIGVVESTQGSGNYISQGFTQPMTDILSLMYFLKGIDRQKVTAFRHMIEREALLIGIGLMSAEAKNQLQEAMEKLLAADSEEERIQHDRTLHYLIVQSSQNDFLICNYEALMHMIDRTMAGSRARIIQAMSTNDSLESAHRQMAQGILENDPQKALAGLERHFEYMKLYDTEES